MLWFSHALSTAIYIYWIYDHQEILEWHDSQEFESLHSSSNQASYKPQ